MMPRSLIAAVAAVAGAVLFLLGGTVHKPAVALVPTIAPHVEIVATPDGNTAYQCVIASTGIWCEPWAERD